MSDTKAKTRYFKPGISGGLFYVRRSREDDDGSTTRLADFEIGPSGVAVNDPTLLDTLDSHPLKGHRFGFYEVDSLAKPRVVANNADDAETETIPSDTEEPVDELSIRDTKTYIRDNGLSDKQVVALTEGDERVGIQRIHDAAAKRLEEGDAETETIVKEDIANINQLKDYVQDQPGVDGRELTTPDKILAAAKQLDPPHEFPNLTGGG